MFFGCSTSVLQAWESNWSRGIFKRRGQSEAEWGKSNFIQIKRIREVMFFFFTFELCISRMVIKKCKAIFFRLVSFCFVLFYIF